MMAYVTAEDDTAAIELVVFPRSLQQCGISHRGQRSPAYR